MTMTVMPVRGRVPRRVAMVSVHTSPLDQPGTGDAGGMNVYVVELARRLAALGRRGGRHHPRHQLRPAAGGRAGARRHGPARHRRPVRGPGQGGPARPSCAPSPRALMRIEAARPSPAGTTWCTPTTGSPARSRWLAAERWDVPLVHSMHTMAKVKNLTLADGRRPRAGRPRDRRGAGRRGGRPAGREHRRGGAASSSTSTTRTPTRVAVVPPGVDLDLFSPGLRGVGPRAARPAGRRVVLLFVGRIQPLKAPDVLLRAAARLVERDPRCASGWSSPSSAARPAAGWPGPSRCSGWPPSSGIADCVRFVPPVPQARAARLVPRRRRHRRPVVQRVVRAGRGRVAGLRHAGRRGRRRRPAHRRRRRRVRRARRRARPAGVRRRARRPGPRPGRARAGWAAARCCTPAGSAGPAPRPACSRSTRRRCSSARPARARGRPLSRSAGDARAGSRRRGPARRARRRSSTRSRRRARSSSSCPARRSSRPR